MSKLKSLLGVLLQEFNEDDRERFKDANFEEVSDDQVRDFMKADLDVMRANYDKKVGNKDGDNPDDIKRKAGIPTFGKSRLLKSGGGEVPVDKKGNKMKIKGQEVTNYAPKGYNMFDTAGYIKAITRRPEDFFGGTTKKMEHTVGDDYITVKFGIPALVALVYNEKKKKFVKVSTCPKAGACVGYCFALQGRYLMQSSVMEANTRNLNFMLNDPVGFENLAYHELYLHTYRAYINGKQLRIRWNDVGDFFSEDYFNITKRVTDRLVEAFADYETKDGEPPLRSYAYTKVYKYLKEANNNYVFNFSTDAASSEVSQSNFKKDKLAKVIPRKIVNKYKTLVGGTTPSGKPSKARELKREDVKPMIMKEYGDKYDLDIRTLLFDDELPPIEQDEGVFSVIVRPKDGSDLPAQRRDVRATFIVEHR